MLEVLTTIKSASLQMIIGLMGLGFLVFIHELGHFLVAKLSGVKVNTFAIGFGKTIWGFRRGDTEYCFKAIPFGGFVAMAGEQPEDDKTGQPNEFAQKPVPVRMAIAVAGPFINVLFAFFVLVILYMFGIQEPISNEIKVGEVTTDSPAQQAGIQAGDKIISLKNKPVSSVEQFFQDIALETDNVLPIVVQRDTQTLSFTIKPEMHKMGFAWSGLIPGETRVVVSGLQSGWPAISAGFKKNDQILTAEGLKIPDSQTFIKIIKASRGREILIGILRDSAHITMPVTPELDNASGDYKIGLGIGTLFNTPTRLVKRSFSQSLTKSWEKNLDYSVLMFRFMSGLFKGKIKIKALSGPVGILQVIGSSFRRSLQQAAEFMALISLNLGLVNLLPLIITDGGVILFLFLEAIRRKPLTTAVQLRINQVAISFFIILAVIITFHDLLKFPMFLD